MVLDPSNSWFLIVLGVGWGSPTLGADDATQKALWPGWGQEEKGAAALPPLLPSVLTMDCFSSPGHSAWELTDSE